MICFLLNLLTKIVDICSSLVSCLDLIYLSFPRLGFLLKSLRNLLVVKIYDLIVLTILHLCREYGQFVIMWLNKPQEKHFSCKVLSSPEKMVLSFNSKNFSLSEEKRWRVFKKSFI